jgi:tRNA/tmRNA/rRNA uracil-C5-methylase (TrmA/RlmC/RlmD family)
MNRWLNSLTEWIPEGMPDAMELFSGSGLVGGYARKKLGNYKGYEFNDLTLNFARKNFSRMNMQGIFESMDLYRSVPDFSKAKLIIANPPRAGLKKKIIDALKHWKGQLIYSSCNPHTMNRDIKDLIDLGFSCNHSAIFDFFPGTPHLEVAMSLVR